MNKRDYMNKLLELCTVRQKDFFNRVYPDGPKDKQLKTAIFQIENTLSKSDLEVETLKAKIKELEESFSDVERIKHEYRNTITGLEEELGLANQRIEALENPINIQSADVQERLDLLSALEAGGVDNWDWYSESISEYQKQKAQSND